MGQWVKWVSFLDGSYGSWVDALSPMTHLSASVTFIVVNAAGVAGVATPPIFDLQGSSCVDDLPNILTSVLFFASAELLNTASRCRFHLRCAQCTVLYTKFVET